MNSYSRIARIFLSLTLLAAGSLDAAPLHVKDPRPAYATDHVLVRFKSGVSDVAQSAMVQRRALRVQRTLGGSRIALLEVPIGDTPENLAKRLRTEEASTIEDVQLDYLRVPVLTPNDPFLGSEYHVTRCNLTAAWDHTTGAGITIAIADTGADLTHPDLAPHLLPGFNFGDNNSNVQDFYGHGTAVGGMAAAVGNNGIGVAGAAYNASILPIKITTGASGSAFDSAIIASIEYAADHGAKVVNVSFGSDTCGVCAPNGWIAAAAYMKSKGGLVTVAAGNGDSLNNPCQLTCDSHPGMVIVAATDSSDVPASFTNFGSAIDISAPGVSDATTLCTSCSFGAGLTYGAVDGTSFAAPLVAGIAGLVYAINPNFSADQVEQILFDSSDNVGLGPNYGHGRINAGNAVSLAITRSAALQPAASGDVFAFPNPWDVRTARQKKVTLTNLPTNATVKLFTLSGFWIKTLTPQAGQAVWDLTNDSGQDVASGLYLYLVTGDGDVKVKGKIALIR